MTITCLLSDASADLGSASFRRPQALGCRVGRVVGALFSGLRGWSFTSDDSILRLSRDSWIEKEREDA